MNSQAFFLFLVIIILFGFAICFFTNQSKYREGMENKMISFSSNTGATATLSIGENGLSTITVTNANGTKTIYTRNKQNDNMIHDKVNIYNGTKGEKATLNEKNDKGYILYIYDINDKLVDMLSSINSINSNSTNSTNSNIINKFSNINYDNYNHYSGTSYPTTFYGPNGGTARIIQNGDSTTVVITNKNGSTDIYYIKDHNKKNNEPMMNTYYGPNGTTATIVTNNNGKKQVIISSPINNDVVYDEENIASNQPLTYTTSTPTSSYLSGSEYPSTYASTSTSTSTNRNNNSNKNEYNYANYLPKGIPKNMIPQGEEDLYILKSEVVPPVCPACPEPIIQCPNNINPDDIPPCPPCARCPEPAFDCKKVPNYNAFNPNYMPVPVLTDFSGFGM